MKYHIVIARYNENIEWIKYIDTNLFDIFVYNKGSEFITSVKCKIINLNNTGRESHTYLYHIINNYYNLPNKIIFTQGHPFDHVRNTFFYEINNLNDCNIDFFYFSNNILSIKYDKNSNKFLEYGILNGKEWINYHQIDSPIAKTMKKLYDNFNVEDLNIVFGTGAIYSVNKNLIEKNEKSFYLRCIDILNNSYNLINPDEGHIFERLWYHIFNKI
jgi:hypothetical protein